ncbi:uncharacterized protein LOC141610647 isoform X2 [Silene latifolia]|uniref:uncharacterized protein LOC141610647 isoform X2 n=1 Tax=Silene latifolia TaxID=37657 RepID=UPI003D771198
MALKTAFISEHQTRFLDRVVGDQSQVQVPAEVSVALSSFSYDANCFYSKSNGKKLYRKKSRSKAKLGKKKADKVFPEEFFSDTGKEHHLSSSKSPTSHKHNKTSSTSDLVKEDLSPTLRLSHSCVELKNLSDAKGHNREEVHECSLSEISNCKAGPLPKRKLHNPQSFSGTSQDMCRSVSSNSGHSHVPKSRATSVSIAKKKRSNINNMRKKDQSRLTWKRCQSDRSNESRRETMSLPDHANFDSISQTSSVPSQQAALSCDELAVTSNFPAKQKKASSATKSLDADDMLNRGICVDIGIDSCQRVAEGVSSEYQDSLFSTKPIEMIHVVKLDESNGHRNKFGKRKNNGWKASRAPLSKSYRHHRQPFPFQPQHVQSKEKVYSKDTSTFDPLHPGMKLPAVKPVEEKHIQNVMNGWSDATCFKSNMSPGIRRGQDTTQHQSARKWIPVCKKNTSIPETSAGTNENITDNSPMEKKEDIELEGDVISISIPEAPIEHISANLLSDNDIPSVMEQASDKVECHGVQSVKNYTQSIHVSDGFLHHPDDSQFVEQAFISSYRMQLASEGVHRTTGYPLAEFERLLFSATPTIDSSVLSKPCDGSFSDVLSNLILCREQTPNISLHSVLDWYEEPGNYGLKVDVNRSHIQEGCVADTESFHAHFVPLLSAIQLFGHNYPSSSFGKRQDQSLEAHGVEASLHTPLCGNPAIDVHDITKPFNASGPSVLSNAELLFEFFESEQPQRRKPLHNKIVELASEGTSNNQVYGDPSKLDCTSLVDLHPASWFSVAWYPIYRIPEGKMRAAFLTYHSLGYFVQRCTTNDFSNLSPFSLALPVIGLQSYSAQAELWFSLNMETESSLGQMSSAVLKERLRTLEENANFFARGSVFKDRVMVTNRQPDYEFFMSRKGKPLYL